MSQRAERSLYGRHWEVELAAYPAFTAQLNLLSPRLAWGGGLALTCLLAALVGPTASAVGASSRCSSSARAWQPSSKARPTASSGRPWMAW